MQAAAFFYKVERVPFRKAPPCWEKLDRGNRPPIPSGTFTPSGNQTILHLPIDLGGAMQMAVTVERGALQAPTTNPIFVAPLSSV